MDFDRIAVNDSLFDRTFRMVINNLTTSEFSDSTFAKQNIDSLIEESYKQMASTLNLGYPNGKRRPKNMLFSGYHASTGISGYFGPFLNEIHMNKYLLPQQYPVILAHEKAHQFGITSEAEASFYAWVVCQNSTNESIRYSANLFIASYFLNSVNNKIQRDQYLALFSDAAINDRTEIRDFWRSWRNPKLDALQSKFYDWYLKGNNIPSGLNNYGGVVKMICEYEQSKLQ